MKPLQFKKDLNYKQIMETPDSDVDVEFTMKGKRR